MCLRNLSFRSRLANQHAQTRHTFRSNASPIRQFRVMSVRQTLAHHRGQGDLTRVREKTYQARGHLHIFVGLYVSGPRILFPCDTLILSGTAYDTGDKHRNNHFQSVSQSIQPITQPTNQSYNLTATSPPPNPHQSASE